ncbi:MAG: transcriptional regulator [Candidatus Poribacteria bacterium]|nr:transcriptional regulator [Candidatus Poribacteria bacterium]
MSIIAKDIQTHWRIIQPLFSIRDENEYDKAITTLNALIDEVGADEQHPLYELLDILGTVIHAYEEKHHPIPECNGVEVLKLLVEEHQLKPIDLPELGPPDFVLEILNGERDLTVTHIRTLAERFQVSPAVFV